MRQLALITILLSTACTNGDKASGGSGSGSGSGSDPSGSDIMDSDGDGTPDADDCAPNDPTIHPGADEGCDLIDSDCDGALGGDELDGDGDGFAACEECDDTTDAVYPGADETCNGIDDDCDGTTDEDASWYPDSDSDGYGDETASAVLSGCDDAPAGHVADATDCDDNDPDISPSAVEVCDPLDVDEDCNGLSDNDDPDATGGSDFAPDADGDGYGDATAPLETWCDAPSGMVADTTDCDDDDASTYPGAPEVDVGLLEDPACDGGGVGSLALADFEFIGENRDDRAGYSVSSAGDVDGDGLDDLFVGAPYYDGSGTSNGGKAYLLLGRTLVRSTTSSIDLGDADFEFVGESTYDRGGYSVSSAGDVDGDGLDDLFVGAHNNNDGGDFAGKAYLLLGGTLMASTSNYMYLRNADFEFIGENSEDRAGISVSTAGDVDGDGLDDLIVGSRYNSDGGFSSGKAHLILGSTLAASTSTSIDLANADFEFIGESAGDEAGSSVSTAGDVDGDGLDDLVVGAHRSDGGGPTSGKAYLILGSTLAASTSTSIDLGNADFVLIGENGGDQAGVSVSEAGDVDGDGLDDLFVGADNADDGGSSAGKAYLLLGSTLATSTFTSIDLRFADFQLIGENSGDLAGGSVSAAGDVDGDGFDDLVVGADYNDDGGIYAGKAYLIRGSTVAASTSPVIDLSDADFAFIGENSFDEAGGSVSTAGDVNGDGLDDLVVGAADNSEGGVDAGKAYLILSHL